MTAKKSIVSANAPKYRTTRKRTKPTLLNKLTHLTRLGRKYLSFMLCNAGRNIATPTSITIIADPTCSLP